MIQGLIAIILLALAAALYIWGRNRPTAKVSHTDADVILGLAETPKSPSPSVPIAEAVKPLPPKLPLERQIIFLRAPAGHPYSGYELLQSLLSCGLRFGEHKFFHRYEKHSETAAPLFTVAAATKTGELDPSTMGNFSCGGLSIFLTLDHHLYPSVNFELMLDTVTQLADDLGGQILDENQVVLSIEKIQQIRGKIKTFETSQQSMELFT